MGDCQIMGEWDGENSRRPHDQVALQILLESLECARQLQRDAWQFAVEFPEFRNAGVSRSVLRMLVAHGFVRHALEVVQHRARERKFRSSKNLSFHESSCFVLTDKGERQARKNRDVRVARMESAATKRLGPNNDFAGQKPCWDAQLRVLSFGDRIVKTFKRPAPLQELIIVSFEELLWDVRIDDPLPPERGMDPKERLHDTIKKLNQGQINALIRFYGDGTGRGVCWQMRNGK